MDKVEIFITPRGAEEFYPSSCVTDQQKREFDQRHLDAGLPIPAPHRLPKDSLLRAESLRRRAANNV